MRLFRRKPVSLGRLGENAAVWHLRRRGYRILVRNAQLGPYEIDIIARKRDITAFVEVKTRRENPLAPPEASVHAAKRRHIRKAAHRYIAQAGDPDMYYRFDIASVIMPERGKPAVTYYENAFPDE